MLAALFAGGLAWRFNLVGFLTPLADEDSNEGNDQDNRYDKSGDWRLIKPFKTSDKSC